MLAITGSGTTPKAPKDQEAANVLMTELVDMDTKHEEKQTAISTGQLDVDGTHEDAQVVVGLCSNGL